MKSYALTIPVWMLLILWTGGETPGQNVSLDIPVSAGGTVQIKNHFGRIEVETSEELDDEAKLRASSPSRISGDNLRIASRSSRLVIEVLPPESQSRIDLKLVLPERTRLRLETTEGAIHVVGNFADARAESETGTIYADVSTEILNYRFQWTGSKPRVISDVDLEKVREKSAGRFQIKGKIREEKSVTTAANSEPRESNEAGPDQDGNKKKQALIRLDFSTLRGIILLNVSPNEVPSNLRERPLTDAAKAIIRSGDSLLTNAIRRSSPKFFGEYAATLPPRQRTPLLTRTAKRRNSVSSRVKRVTVQVTDLNNRAIFGLKKADFVLTERGTEMDVLEVEPSTAPFNLVLLLDVSGSVEHYVDFIRKAARSFLDTTSPQDKIAMTTFNEDVQPLSSFTKDRKFLSEVLDTFDAGGGTAYYDSLAYSLTETLRPLRGERTAIVVLSDGDDNRSFLPFNALLGSIQESGALIYPLYVPSGLIAASSTNDPNIAVDPLRTRYMALTSKAQKEGEQLAKISGGVYYPISRLSELQKAYDDIVVQLRTAYTITYRSDSAAINSDRASPNLKVKVKRDTAFVKLGPVVAVSSAGARDS